MIEASFLVKNLERKNVQIVNLLLDANNPRFFDNDSKIATNKIDTASIQSKTFAKITSHDIDDLKDSIKNVGFLTIDRIVAVRLKEDSEKYVVIEGNRRIAGVKKLLEDIDEGLEVSKDVLSSLKEIEILVLKDMMYDNSLNYQLLVQGIRHISGVKEWKPYQQAKALVSLVDELNYSITEGAETLGLGRSTASWMRKAYYAFEKMRSDEELSVNKIKNINSYFSYFVEVLKDVNLRKFFSWNDKNNEFDDREELLNLYTWIGVYTTQEELSKQITKAIDIRKLNVVLSNSDSKISLYSGSNIEQAYGLIQKNNAISTNYTMQLNQMLKNLEEMPSTFIKRMTEEDKDTLNAIIKLAEEHLK